jgi:hypothetical protein
MRIESQRSHQPAGDSDRLTGWRRERLLSAGFPPDLADRLAHERGADLHALLDLVERRCPPRWRRGFSLRSTRSRAGGSKCRW